MSREDRVAHFHQAAGNLTHTTGGPVTLYINTFSEELAEFNEAMVDFLTNPSEETRANLVKEWADVQYTLSGLGYFFEIDGDEAFTRVADNNDTKIGVNGEVTRNEYGKILKPEGYKPADMKGL